MPSNIKTALVLSKMIKQLELCRYFEDGAAICLSATVVRPWRRARTATSARDLRRQRRPRQRTSYFRSYPVPADAEVIINTEARHNARLRDVPDGIYQCNCVRARNGWKGDMVALARAYRYPGGIERNNSLCACLFAADRGNAKAPMELALMLWRGDGIARDVSKTIILLAAAAGESGAMNTLGVLAREGDGRKRDDAEALACSAFIAQWLDRVGSRMRSDGRRKRWPGWPFNQMRRRRRIFGRATWLTLVQIVEPNFEDRAALVDMLAQQMHARSAHRIWPSRVPRRMRRPRSPPRSANIPATP